METTLEVTARPTVLIANIGNRNLLYQGEEIDKKRFRELTLDLLTRYEEVRDQLEPAIINWPISDYPGLHRLYLITTDQPASTHPHYRATDTVHEGRLLQRLLADEWPSWPVELIEYQGNPTVEAEIYPALRPRLQAIVEAHADDQILFLDAGGTPQLKTAARAYLHYLLPEPGRFQPVYITPQDERKEVDQTYHQRYQLLNVARQFVQRYEYDSALTVLKGLPASARVGAALLAQLRVAAARLRFDNFPKVDTTQLPEAFQSFYAAQAPVGSIEFDEFDDDQRFEIFEIASVAQLLLLQKRQLAPAVLSFIRLLEEIGQALAATNDYSVAERKGQRTFIEKTQQQVLGIFPNLRPKDGNIPFGVPYLMAYAISERGNKLREAIEVIKPAVSHINGDENAGINLLRNQTYFTHRNRGVTSEDIQKHDRTPPGFLGSTGRAAAFFAKLGLPATNIYDQMNREILDLFQQE